MRFATLIAAAFAFAIAAPAPTLTVHLIGDSTMADKPDPAHNPERGWGQSLPMFVDSTVSVKNYAVNGRSSKSFIDEGRWTTVVSALKAGDIVVIQFGHNDEKSEDTTRYAAADGAYRENLRRFVRESRAANATPVLMTPIVRRQWSATGTLTNSHGAYPDAVRAVAAEMHVSLVDMEQLTSGLLQRYGVEGSKSLFVWTTEGQFAAFPAARQDNTHLSPDGAEDVARLAARGLRALGGTLAAHIIHVN